MHPKSYSIITISILFISLLYVSEVYAVSVNIVDSKLNKLTLTVIILGFILVGLVLFCIYRIISLVEQQRKLAGLVKTENFQKQMDEIFNSLNNLDTRLRQIENSYKNQYQNLSENQPSNYTSNISNSNISQISSTPQRTQRVIKTKPLTGESNQQYNLSHSPNTNIQLVSVYNKNASLLLNQATAVSESQDTIQQRRLGGNISPIFESDARGNYWIIEEGNIKYLVPKAKMKINEHNYLTISTLFNCSGYNPNYTNNYSFTLIKPAKVSSRGEQWELIEVGEIVF